MTFEDIDQISAQAVAYLQEIGLENGNILRMRLALEEMLLKWREYFGEDTECRAFFGEKWRKPYLSVEVSGGCYNPMSRGDDEDDFSCRMLSALGLNISFSYVGGKNRLYLRPKPPKKNPLRPILLSVFLSVLCGVLVLNLPSPVGAVSLAVVSPLSNTFLRMLSAIASPMIFLSVVYGIYNIGDIATLGSMGKHVLIRFLRNIFGIILLVVVCAIPFLQNTNLKGTIQVTQLSSIYQMILDIMPPNIIEPFSSGNSLQLIFLAVVSGVVMIILKDETEVPAELVNQLNILVTYLMGLISDLVPFFIFICLFKVIISGDAAQLVSSWKLVVFFLVVSFLFLLINALYISVRFKIGLGKLARKISPTFLVGLTTASSSAAFETNVNGCKRRLGIEERFVNFCVPIGTILYKPAGAVRYITLGVFLALEYQVDISIAWLAMAIFVTGVLAVASPPIPGGALTCFSVLFLQLGIPDEALVVAMTLNVFLDFFITAINLAMLQLTMIQNADELGMLNLDVLRK